MKLFYDGSNRFVRFLVEYQVKVSIILWLLILISGVVLWQSI